MYLRYHPSVKGKILWLREDVFTGGGRFLLRGEIINEGTHECLSLQDSGHDLISRRELRDIADFRRLLTFF